MERATKRDIFERSVAGTVLAEPQTFYLISDIVNQGMFDNNVAGLIVKMTGERKTRTEIGAMIREFGQNPIDYIQHKNKYDLQSNANLIKEDFSRDFERMLLMKQLGLIDEELSIDEVHSQIQKERDDFYSQFIEKCDKLKTITEVKDQLMAASSQDGGITGIRSGIETINEIRGGLQGGDYILLGGRPGQGKTSLAIKEFVDVLMQGFRAVFATLEMPKKQIIKKMSSYLTRVGVDRMNAGECGASLDMVLKAVDSIYELDYEIETSNNLDVLVSRFRALHYKKKLDFIVIDYLQLIRCKIRDKTERTSEISMTLKRLAVELDCPIYVLSQLNREVEKQAVQRPANGHLRDSGSLEADADMIFFVFNPEYYNHQTLEWVDRDRTIYNVDGEIEILNTKNRHGKTKSMRMKFNGNFDLPNGSNQLVAEIDTMPRAVVNDSVPF